MGEPFEVFRLPEEYVALRESVRELTASRIAPHAAVFGVAPLALDAQADAFPAPK